MKRTACLLIMLLCSMMIFALPAQLSKKGNPKLYKQLLSQAKANLQKLPQNHKKAFGKMLEEYPDVLMAFLLAYESDANLAAANPADVVSNYEAIVELIEKEGLKGYSAEFFLSYIAKQTVSDEAISPYRKAFLEDDLQRVIDDTTNDLDRYRAATLWCVSRLQFQQTSGRDQSPLDITQRSLIGRCEEMQILFVAAARTVGLPSRPASTPWWAHMDNNHAWAEVFLDGAWHYTGDMDSAWYPDQTWFSGMIDKTVLLLADGSLASENDEILDFGRYDTLINSTRNYAKERSRTISLQITGENGKPVSGAMIMPMVFNWGSLRAITALKADAEGKCTFTAGRGAFFVSVFDSNGKALHLVPSAADTLFAAKITLKADSISQGSFLMEYPSNPMVWDKQPDEYRAAVQKEKDLWQQKVRVFESEAVGSAVFSDSLSLETAKACRGNHDAFWQFVQRNQPIKPEFLEFLLSGDSKFLWQASAEQFEAVYQSFLRFPEHHNLETEPLSLFSPSVFYEDIPKPAEFIQGKAQLYPQALRFDVPEGRDGVIATLKQLNKRYKIKSSKALSGLLPLDVALVQKHLTPVQYRILACSALRANGYPAEFSRIPDLVSVFVDEDWQYVNVRTFKWEDQSSKQQPQTFVLTLQIEDEQALPIRIGDEQLTLCRYVEGTFYPLNNRFEYLGSGLYRGMFPASDSYLQFGYRISDSATSFYLNPLTPAAGDSIHIKLSASNYPRSWKAAEEDILALFGEEFLSNQQLILIGNADQENSRRIADKLNSLSQQFVWIGHSATSTQPDNYQVLPAWLKLVQEDTRHSLRTITLIKKNGSWQMYEGMWDKLP